MGGVLKSKITIFPWKRIQQVKILQKIYIYIAVPFGATIILGVFHPILQSCASRLPMFAMIKRVFFSCERSNSIFRWFEHENIRTWWGPRLAIFWEKMHACQNYPLLLLVYFLQLDSPPLLLSSFLQINVFRKELIQFLNK